VLNFAFSVKYKQKTKKRLSQVQHLKLHISLAPSLNKKNGTAFHIKMHK